MEGEEEVPLDKDPKKKRNPEGGPILKGAKLSVPRSFKENNLGNQENPRVYLIQIETQSGDFITLTYTWEEVEQFHFQVVIMGHINH
jgi:hypothetical protein